MNYLRKNLDYLIATGRADLKKLADITGLPPNSISSGEVKFIESWLVIASELQLSLDMLVGTDIELRESSVKKNISFVCLDVDGVLTDGGMYYTEAGDEFKKFNTKDGMAIKLMVSKGLNVAFLSNGTQQKLIEKRAKLLGAQYVWVGAGDKKSVLDGWISQLKISMDNVAYIGDDINDLHLLKEAGFSACPANALPVVKNAVHVVLSRKGGDACVRELADKYLL
jgi:3-deoxy-D-manno-octulosonate 8-phosphate phosphatase (KDO 8-P phosphatase)